MQIWPGQGAESDQTAVITVVEVDAQTKLPVTVRIPVTPGTTVEWAGEILGGSAESDIEQPFKLIQGQGGQFAEFTLTKSRRGQIDAIGLPLKITSDAVSVSVEYVQTRQLPADGDIRAHPGQIVQSTRSHRSPKAIPSRTSTASRSIRWRPRP